MKALIIFALITTVLCRETAVTLFCLGSVLVAFLIWMLNKIADKGY